MLTSRQSETEGVTIKLLSYGDIMMISLLISQAQRVEIEIISPRGPTNFTVEILRAEKVR